ncbi:quinoprotein dehydrogenase-associated SoxYZ-like carrier [Rhodopila sp.]|uniref:quinoprotein dehydrogenase-associated SoxYZ-like carrier n=1 Tax=Rhodopila sp. TaxID=2480087 RepID=UPI003D12097B
MRALRLLSRRQAIAVTLASGAFGRLAEAKGESGDDPWPALAGQIFNDRPIEDGSAVLAIDAPYRAADAAVVPISIHSLLPAGDNRRIRSVTLVVDQNPSPLAAKFSPGRDSGIKSLSTRIRVDSYTKMHAVAEMTDGRLFAAERFVKAAGGCSAPAAKQEGNAIPIGTMRLRQFPRASDADSQQIQFMIRHPNNSGMQMDQLTRLYVPAHFVSSISIWQGDDLLLAIESGISISENPEFRFDYRPNGATEFRAEARDNEGSVFNQSWSATRA